MQIRYGILRLAATAAVMAVSFSAAGIQTANAGGMTEHLKGAASATLHVRDPQLQALLIAEQQGKYGTGTLFPDTMGYPGPSKQGLGTNTTLSGYRSASSAHSYCFTEWASL